ncbi:hypothetical protein BJY54_000968 [Streptomyces nodosus]|nr:hypothetical protein [Streptomyces nodosus]
MSRSEPLREEQGEDEITQQGDGHDQADDVLGGHSFATPLATSATSANTAIVVTTKARSAIVNSWNEVRIEQGRFEGTAFPQGFGFR